MKKIILPLVEVGAFSGFDTYNLSLDMWYKNTTNLHSQDHAKDLPDSAQILIILIFQPLYFCFHLFAYGLRSDNFYPTSKRHNPT